MGFRQWNWIEKIIHVVETVLLKQISAPLLESTLLNEVGYINKAYLHTPSYSLNGFIEA